MTMFMLFSPLDWKNNGALLGDPSFGLTKHGQNEAPFANFSFCFTRNQPYVRCLVDMLHTTYSVELGFLRGQTVNPSGQVN